MNIGPPKQIKKHGGCDFSFFIFFFFAFISLLIVHKQCILSYNIKQHFYDIPKILHPGGDSNPRSPVLEADAMTTTVHHAAIQGYHFLANVARQL